MTQADSVNGRTNLLRHRQNRKINVMVFFSRCMTIMHDAGGSTMARYVTMDFLLYEWHRILLSLAILHFED